MTVRGAWYPEMEEEDECPVTHEEVEPDEISIIEEDENEGNDIAEGVLSTESCDNCDSPNTPVVSSKRGRCQRNKMLSIQNNFQ